MREENTADVRALFMDLLGNDEEKVEAIRQYIFGEVEELNKKKTLSPVPTRKTKPSLNNLT